MQKFCRATCLLLLILTGLTCTGYTQGMETAEKEGPSTGYLHIQVVDIDSFYVVVNNDFSKVYHFASGDSLALEEGKYRFTLAKAYFRDLDFMENISEGETRRVSFHMFALINLPATRKQSSFPRIHWGNGAVVVSDHDSDIYVNGEYSGTGSAVVHHRDRFTVESRNPAGEVRSRTIRPTQASFKVFELYHRPDRNRAMLWAMLPGAPQFYKDQYLKGVLIASGFAIVAGFAVHIDSRFRSYNRDYNDILTLYRRESDPRKAFHMGKEADDLFGRANRYWTGRNYLIMGAAIIYAYGILDGISSPPGGFRNTNLTIDPYLDFEESSVQVGISVKRPIP